MTGPAWSSPVGQVPPPKSPPSSRHSHPAHRLDHQLARAAIGWSIWSDTDVDEVADRLVTLAAGNRTALERALSRFHQGEPGADGVDTTAGRATAALRLALARGSWAW